MRAMQRYGHAYRSRQMGSDRRGLRNDRQVGMPEYFVPATRDRLVRQSEQPLQDVADGAGTCYLARSGQIETARAVVQQRRIGRPGGHRDHGVAFVAGRGDRVEAPSLLLQRPAREVQMPAGRLSLEQGPKVERTRGRLIEPRPSGGPLAREVGAEMNVQRVHLTYRRKVVSGESSTMSICAFCSRPE